MLAEAKAAGARILKPAEDAFWGGYTGYFADPDGHPWEVAWNPEWTIADDGGVRLRSKPVDLSVGSERWQFSSRAEGNGPAMGFRQAWRPAGGPR